MKPRRRMGRVLRLTRRASLSVVAVALGLAFCLGASAASVTHLAAGDLDLTLGEVTNGIVVLHLRDTGTGRDLAAHPSPPLFAVALRQVGTKHQIQLAADHGWRRCRVKRRGSNLELDWAHPTNATLAGVSVTATATPVPQSSAIHWHLRVADRTTNWSVIRVVFPQVGLANLGTNGAVLFPRGPGEVRRGVWEHPFTYHGNYPGGWCSMQFMAAFQDFPAGCVAPPRPTGLYVAVQDPWGSTKDLTLRSDPATRTVRMSFTHPAPNLGLPGNGFVLPGEAVWQLLRGDWFDAARIYRSWAEHHAKWWPALGKNGRSDTPLWMRRLNAWAMTGGAPSNCVAAVKRFRDFLGVPVGFHWYNWHHNPFDNDYPHYFPAKPGFTAAVAQLKSEGVFVMPYINGRLWDTHDRGTQDYEFTRLALPAATKDEQGRPYVETYQSKETNGQPVRLAVMCPTTKLWQGTVSRIVLRLLGKYGTSGVYIDQIAAAAPKLCMDRTHGHPLGGGHWWTAGYWQMLDRIRRAKPRDTILTTECNGEPYIRWFDGYLTWHWQFNGQVPAFPAVYGGTIQMFGRAYRGGSTRDLALRMKAGQQLVFGEQLGWIDPAMMNHKASAEFFRELVQLRARFSRYFYAGEMARPPRFTSAIPQVKADWRWSGQWWVTTDAVLTGAWRLPAEHRLLLLFVNVSETPVTAKVAFDPAKYDVSPGDTHTKISRSGARITTEPVAITALKKPILFPAGQAQAWEITDK